MKVTDMNSFSGWNSARGPDCLQDPAVGAELRDAILAQDSVKFVSILSDRCPELVGQPRLFGVLVLAPRGIAPLLVDQSGSPLENDRTMDALTPIEMLNVEFVGDTMNVQIGDETWQVPTSALGIKPN